MNRLKNKAGKKVIDSSTILHCYQDYSTGGYLVTNSVLREIVSDPAKAAVDQALGKGYVSIRDPGPQGIAKALKAAEETGDAASLSTADIDVIAVALETGSEILTDDYAIQNVAAALGVAYRTTAQPGISKRLTWIKRCPGCRREYPIQKLQCPFCGSELERRCRDQAISALSFKKR